MQSSIENADTFPASFAQQRLWFLDRLLDATGLYNNSWAVRLSGILETSALQQSFVSIIQRHEVLRTSFYENNGILQQAICTSIPFKYQLIDLSPLSPDKQECENQRILDDQANKPFNLKKAPLIRAVLVKLSEQEHTLLVTLHHIISDAWSMGIFKRELAGFYNAFSRDRIEILPELAIQYADYSVWQLEQLQGEVLRQQLAYWKKQLANVPVLDFPTDSLRLKQPTYQGAEVSIQLSGELTQGLKILSQQQGATLFMTLLATFQILLYRYSGQQDIVVGSPVAGRNKLEIEPLIGFFVNTLALRTDLSSNPGFNDLLRRVRKVCLEAYTHQDLPFEKLVAELQTQRDMSLHPLFQVMLVLHPAVEQDIELSGLTAKKLIIPTQTAKFDLFLSLQESSVGLKGTLEYSTDLFNRETIHRFAGHFQILLESIVKQPQMPIAELPLLTKLERHQLVIEWNHTQMDFPWHDGEKQSNPSPCLHHLFEQQVNKTPEAIALQFEQQDISYRELNERSNQLAHYLLSLGVGIESPVALCLKRSVDMLIALFGILKAGAAYVPLNPEFPKMGLLTILDDVQPIILITQQHIANQFSGFSGTTLLIDSQPGFWQDQSINNPKPLINLKNLAYILYTSGSTGRPKGVMIEHLALNNFLAAIEKQVFHPQVGDECLNITPLFFDISVLEIFLPLISGATVVIINQAMAKDAELLKQFIDSRCLALMQATPTSYQLLTSVGWTPASNMTLLCGGEKLLPALAQTLLKSGNKLWNLYGPTETTVWSTCFEVANTRSSIPIGHPLANTDVYILDPLLQPVPISVRGELYIGGLGLARGYLNNSELTRASFIPHPFSENKADRLYKTGDKVRWLADGAIEFVERLDRQVKLRGYRIELTDVENVLIQHSQINNAVVRLNEDTCSPGLIAYCISDEESLDEAQVRLELKLYLPDYMIPHRIIKLSGFPLTANRKLDLKALEANLSPVSESAQSSAERLTSTEIQLLNIWTEILQPGYPITVNDNFFSIGGHSLASIQLLAEIEKSLKLRIPLASLFQWTTIAELGKFLDNLANSEEPLQNEHSDSPLAAALFREFISIAIGRTEPRLHPQSLIYQLSEASNLPALYLCGADREIAAHCSSFQVFGMETGFGLMSLSSENIKALASHYVKEIVQYNPTGPYLIGGYCSGGLVAHEIAQQLQAQEKSVALLFLIDQVIYTPYSGNIAFFIFQQNSILQDLQQPGSKKILRKYFPQGWSLDIIPGQHTTTLTYQSAMMLQERIAARIAGKSRVMALNTAAYKVHWKSLDLRQKETLITFSLQITNTSSYHWPAGQIAIGHHWQDQHGVIVDWAVAPVSLKQRVSAKETISIEYTLNKLTENTSLFVIIDLLDQGNSWFSLQGAASFRMLINADTSLIKETLADLVQIQTLHTQGKWRQVIPLYQQALISYPDKTSALVKKLSEALLNTGRTESAKELLVNAVQKTHSVDDVKDMHLMLANIYLNNSDFNSAISEAEQVLTDTNEHPQALAILALSHAHLGDLVIAEEIIDKILSGYRSRKLTTVLLRQLETFVFLLDKNDNDACLKYSRVLMKKDALNPFHYFNNGFFMFRRKKYQKAEEMLMQAIEIFPDHPLFYNNLARIYLTQDNVSAAAILYRKLIKMEPLKIDNFIHLSKIRAQQKHYQTALKILKQASRINPEDEQIKIFKSEIKQLQNETKVSLRRKN